MNESGCCLRGGMRDETSEVIDNGGVKVTFPARCNDPELAKWIYRVMKENNAELQASIQVQLQEIQKRVDRRPFKVVDMVTKVSTDTNTRLKVSTDTNTRLQEELDAAEEEEPPALSLQRSQSQLDRGVTRTVSEWKSTLMQSRGPDTYSGLSLQAPLTGIDWFMHTPIDILAGALIAISTVATFVQLDWKGYLINVDLGLADDGAWPNAEVTFDVLEFVFCIIFLAEFILRIWYFRCTFFLDKLNILDGVVVAAGSILTFVVPHVSTFQTGNTNFVRMIRYVKLVRSLRIVRALHFCHQLRVLIRTIMSSFMSLIWSMAVLFAFMLMGALFLCQTLQDYIMDTTNDLSLEIREWCNNNYGTASKALWTMFEITFSGGWPNYTRTIIEEVSPWYAAFFACYVGGVVFAVIRIITALFLKETLAVAASDAEMMIQQKMKDKQKFASKLQEVFRAADESGDGLVSEAEFHAFLVNPKARALFSAMELESHEVESLFEMLDDGDGSVSFDEFLQGVVRLKGTARSQDVLAILHESRKVLKNLHGLDSLVKQLAEDVDAIQYIDADSLPPPPALESNK